MKIPKYCTFVKSELDYFRAECNFTDIEREYFELRAKDKSNVQCAMIMNVSESQVNRIAKRVKTKIMKVI